MRQSLVDVNVWIALLNIHHVHHLIVAQWFETLSLEEAVLCRQVQLGVARLLSNRTIMQDAALPAGEAWRIIGTLRDDERVQFADEPKIIDAVLPTLFKYPAPTGKLISDAYLAAFAIASSRRLVTLDQGFKQFQGLDAVILTEPEAIPGKVSTPLKNGPGNAEG